MSTEQVDLMGLERYFNARGLTVGASFKGVIWEAELTPTRGELLRYQFRGDMEIMSVPDPAPQIKQYKIYTGTGFGAQFDVPTSAQWQMRRLQPHEEMNLTCRISPDREIRFRA